MAANTPMKGPPPDIKFGNEDDHSLLLTARERYEKAQEANLQNNDEALEDLEFMAGAQWPEEIARSRREDERPMLKINRMPQFVKQVTNEIRQNRPSIKVKPKDDVADDARAELFAGLIRQIENTSDAQVAYNTAAEGAVQCGIGHFRILTEYSTEDTFEQDIRIRRMTNHFAVTWDPFAVEITKSDALFCFVEDEMSHAEYKARYPNSALVEFDFQDTTFKYVGDWLTRDNVRIAEYWTRTPSKRVLALLVEGPTLDITDFEKDEQGTVYDPAGNPLDIVRTRDVIQMKVEMRKINGVEVLEGPTEFPGRYIPIIPVIGAEIFIGRRLYRHGIIRHAKDAQRMYNFWRTAQTEYIALQPKAPWLVTVKNIEGHKDLWAAANVRNLPYLPYTPDNDNGGQAPQRQTPPFGSTGMAQEIMLAAEDMKATTGIYDAGLGRGTGDESGRAIVARQKESDTATFDFIDNVSRAVRHCGVILVDIIPRIYDTERVLRIMNEDETTKKVALNQSIIDQETKKPVIINDISVGKYDVAVTTGPSFATKRAESADWMEKFATAMPAQAALVADLLVKNLDLPGADELAKRLRKALPPGMIEPNENETPPDPVPPSPEQQAKMLAEQTKAKEVERKVIESQAKVDKMEQEIAALRLQNAEKARDMDLADGQIEAIIQNAVQKTLREVMQMVPPAAAPPPEAAPLAPEPPIDIPEPPVQ